MAVIGSVLLLFVWLDHQSKSETSNAYWFLIIGLPVVLYYTYGKTIDRLEREIRWLNETIRAVKDQSKRMRKASIDEGLQLRVDILGDERGEKGKVKDRDEGKSLGEILDQALRAGRTDDDPGR